MRELTAFFRVQGRFIVLVTLCFAATAASGALLVRSVLTPDTGLVGYYPEVRVTRGRVTFAPSGPFSPAMESGLLPGRDRIVSVNGFAVASSRDIVRAVGSVRGFDPFPVVVQREGTGTVAVEVAPSFLPTRIDWIFTLIFCLALSTMAFAVSWKLPHEPWSVPLVLSALFSLLFTCLRQVAYASVVANALFNLCNITPWLLVIFALLFPWERGGRITRIVSISTILALFTVFCALRVGFSTAWLSTGEEPFLDAYKLVGQVGNAGDGLAYAILACLLGSAYARTRLPRDRAILQWLLAGMLIALPPYFFFDQLPLVLGGDAARIGLGSLADLFLSVLPLSLLCGLMARRAFNFQMFVARYAVYGILFMLLIAFFTVVYLPLERALRAGYSVGSPLPELFSVGLIFFLLVIIRIPLEKVSAGFVARLTGSQDPTGSRGASLRLSDTVSPADRRLTELRAMLKACARTLRDPVHRLSDLAAQSSTPQYQAAGIQLIELVRALDGLSASGPFIRIATTPQDLARAAVGIATARHGGARIQVHDGARAHVSCCFQEVARALGCALENAVESQAGAGAPILVRITHDDENAVIEVIDHGRGIEAIARRRLFSPFVSTKPGHAGLGLCVSRAIMERNDGTLDLVPGEDGGAVARFTLPRSGTIVGSQKETF